VRKVIFAAVEQAHVCSFACKLARNFEPDAPRGAGDDDVFICESCHAASDLEHAVFGPHVADAHAV
jgi:hypothetical protein